MTERIADEDCVRHFTPVGDRFVRCDQDCSSGGWNQQEGRWSSRLKSLGVERNGKSANDASSGIVVYCWAENKENQNQGVRDRSDRKRFSPTRWYYSQGL